MSLALRPGIAFVRSDVPDDPYARREGAGSRARGEDAASDRDEDRDERILSDGGGETVDEIRWGHRNPSSVSCSRSRSSLTWLGS